MKRNILCVIAVAVFAAIGCSGGKFNPPGLPTFSPNFFHGAPAPSSPVPVGLPGGGPVSGGQVDPAALLKATDDLIAAQKLNEDDEPGLGQSVGLAITNQYRLVSNEALNKYVTFVGLSVASTSQRPDIRYVFGILDTPEINAFSGPNGYIFITRGAIQNMQDEAELAGVLAHEEAHVMLHHGLLQVQTAERNKAFAEFARASPYSRFAGYSDVMIDVITKTGYTQPQETDADSSAVDLVYHAGYNPGSYLNFLERLQQLQPANNSGGIMSTHPGTADRVANVKHVLMNISSVGATLPDRFHKNVKF